MTDLSGSTYPGTGTVPQPQPPGAAAAGSQAAASAAGQVGSNDYTQQALLARLGLIPQLNQIGALDLRQNYANQLARSLLQSNFNDANKGFAGQQYADQGKLFDLQGQDLNLQRGKLGLAQGDVAGEQTWLRAQLAAQLGDVGGSQQFLNTQRGIQQADIGAQQGYQGQQFADTLAKLGYQGAYQDTAHSLAGQLFGLEQGSAQRGYGVNRGEALSQATAGGMVGNAGSLNEQTDLKAQLGEQLGRIGNAQQLETAGYGRDVGTLGVEKQAAGEQNTFQQGQLARQGQMDEATYQRDFGAAGRQGDLANAQYARESGRLQRQGQSNDYDLQTLDIAAQRLGVNRDQARIELDKANSQYDNLAQQYGIDRTELDERLNNGLAKLGITDADSVLAASIELMKQAGQNPQLIQQIIDMGVGNAQGSGG